MEHRRQRQRNLSRAVEEPDFKLLKVHRKLQQSEGSEVTMLRMVQVGETYDLTYSDSDDDWFVCDNCECGGTPLRSSMAPVV